MALRRITVNSGDEYEDLVVIKEVDSIIWNGYKKRMVSCKCKCGKEMTTRLDYLRSGHTTSCGCNKVSACIKHKTTHGCCGTRLYGIWGGMLARCRNKNVKSYKYYGAKGIIVCEEWIHFIVFKNWALSNGYADNLTIDRRNPYNNYEPDNCRWISKSEQRYNRRDNFEINKC